MTDQELENLLLSNESDLSERKRSLADKDKICQAICAFANDLPNHQKSGVIFISVNDDGTSADLEIDDQLLLSLADLRSNGNIYPFPTLKVQKKTFNSTTVAAIIVEPSQATPVRFQGRTWIRVGPRRALATPEEERRLTEKRRMHNLPFELTPSYDATLKDLDELLFLKQYLPSAVATEVLEENNRTYEEKLASLRFINNTEEKIPTYLGLLAVGNHPRYFLGNAYIQFLRIDGTELTDSIIDQAEIHGAISYLIKAIDDKLVAHNFISADIVSQNTEVRRSDYSIPALQQLVRNAILHRSYEGTNAPVRVYWYNDRIEITNPGGPYGTLNQQNFGQPGFADYRNPHLAEVMKNLGFVQRFGIGIALAKKQLFENGNPSPEFKVSPEFISVTVRKFPTK